MEKVINKNGIKFNISKHIVRRLSVENVTNNFPEITPENNTKNNVLKKEDKAGIIQKGGDVKSTPQNSIRKRSEKDGDVESTPQIPAKKGGKKGRFVR